MMRERDMGAVAASGFGLRPTCRADDLQRQRSPHPDPRGPVLPARRLPRRPDLAGAAGADHARPFRPRPLRPRPRAWRRARRCASWRCATARISARRRQEARARRGDPHRRRHRALRAGRARARLGPDRDRGRALPASSSRATTSARRDPTCLPFEVVPCDVFITEATFGLPVFRHPGHARRGREAARIRRRCSPSAPTSSAPTRSARRSA